jgi:hypothetical protein
MSDIAKFLSPMIVAGVAAAVASIGVIESAAAQQRRIPDQTLRTTNSSALDYRSPAMRFVPTPPSFAIAHAPIALRPFVIGNLVCTSNAASDCIVANMPLLSQVDPRLKAPLTAYASQYIVASGVNSGMIIWSEPQFGIGPTPFAPADFAQNIMNVGCYITSLTTLEAAAAANAQAIPSGRALTFFQIGANSLMTGDAAINRLQWQYQRWADKLQPNPTNPSQPSSPDFLQLQEFVSGYPANVLSFHDHGANVSGSDMIAGMRNGTMYLIAFRRYSVSFAPIRGVSQVHLALTYSSHHKIAVSGFQPGAYPLLINDVGNGHRYRVRLTNDIRSIPFRRTVNGAVTTIPPNQVFINQPADFPVAPQLYLVYEGADGVNVSAGGQVFVIEGIQSLTVRRPPRLVPPITAPPAQPTPPPVTSPTPNPGPSRVPG